MNSNNETLRSVDAVLWDFDGTIADSAAKNIAITKQILAKVAPRLTGDGLPRALRSIDDYHVANHGAENWRELYRDYFGMTADEIQVAGPMWNTYQMRDSTGVPLFDGIAETIQCLSRYPQGICSANASDNIRQILADHELDSAFDSIVGYENLPHHEQKPAATGGMLCLEQIFGETRDKTIVFVGDHIMDVMFARALGEALHVSNTVISLVVTWSGADPGRWKMQPDKVLDKPSELTEWINGKD